jgi:hypothetical protein
MKESAAHCDAVLFVLRSFLGLPLAVWVARRRHKNKMQSGLCSATGRCNITL